MRPVLVDPQEIERRVTALVMTATSLPDEQFEELMAQYGALLAWLTDLSVPRRRTGT